MKSNSVRSALRPEDFEARGARPVRHCGRTADIDAIRAATSRETGRLPSSFYAGLGGARAGDAFASGATEPAETATRVNLDMFHRADLIAREGYRTGIAARIAKRGLDIALATVLIVACAPLMILAAVAIKLDSPGPVFYRQRRVGVGGKEFWILKFRSMRQDAEREGARWARLNDDRITRVGAVLRKFRIDEIPQAFNVLANEMSFVGPRPERPEFVQLLRREIPHYDVRHRVKPGITGWAQVNREYGASVDDAREKLTYDLYYIKHYSPMLDLWVVLKTVRVALFGVGSR